MINSNVSRPIAVNQNRYKGITPFQERALTYGQNKVDTLQKEIRDEESGLVYSMYDQDLAQPLIDEFQQKRQSIAKDFHISEYNDIQKGLGELQQMKNDPRYQVLKQRNDNTIAYQSNLAKLAPVQAERYKRELALTQGSSMQDENENYILDPTSELTIANRPDVLAGIAALTKLTTAEINSIDPLVKEINYKADGTPIVTLKTGDITELSNTKLNQFFNDAVKNDPSYNNWLEVQDRHFKKGIIDKKTYDQELAQFDNQISAMASGVAYTNNKRNYQVLGNGVATDEKNAKNGNNDNLNLQQYTTNEAKIEMFNPNPTFPPEISEFQEEKKSRSEKVNAELENLELMLPNGISITPKSFYDKETGKVNTSVYLGEDGQFRNDVLIRDSETGDMRLATETDLNELAMNVSAYNSYAEEDNLKTKAAVSSLSINKEVYDNIINFDNLTLDEKTTVFKKSKEELKNEYDSYVKSESLRPSVNDREFTSEQREKFRQKAISLLPDFESWINNKNLLENGDVIKKVKAKKEELYKKDWENSLVKNTYQFRSPINIDDDKLYSQSYRDNLNNTNPQMYEALTEHIARKKQYTEDVFGMLSNARNVYDDRGNKINLNKENTGLILSTDIESNPDNPSTIELNENIKKVKTIHKGYAFNKISQTYMERIVLLGQNSKGVEVRQELFVQDDNVDKINNAMLNTGSVEEAIKNVGSQLKETNGYLEQTIPGANLKYNITEEKPGEYRFRIKAINAKDGQEISQNFDNKLLDVREIGKILYDLNKPEVIANYKKETEKKQNNNNSNPELLQMQNLITSGEAEDYNTIYAGNTLNPPKPITQMTVQEVLDFQDQMVNDQNKKGNKNVSSAVGVFQIINKTLQGLVDTNEINLDDVFDERTQNKAYNILLQKRGYDNFKENIATAKTEEDKIKIAEKFQLELAKEWASIPVPYDIPKGKYGDYPQVDLKKGDSYYKGVAGNKASHNSEEFTEKLISNNV